MNSTKHISQIILPSLDSQVTDSNENSTGTDLDYLTELKSRTDKLAENWKGEFGVKESYLARLKIVRQAKQELRDDILPTKEELDYCFPGCEHPEARQEPPAPQKPEPTHPPTRQQVEQRLNNPAQSKDDSDKPKLSKKDWEWIEKANHPLGGRLFYGGGVTPLCRTYTNLTNMVKCIRIYTNLSYSFDCCLTSCFNVHCLSTRSYTDSTGVLRLLATRGDGIKVKQDTGLSQR